jgi:hypothetical protein
MNETNVTQSKVTPAALKWSVRHKKASYLLSIFLFILLGGFAGMFLALGLKTDGLAATGLIGFGLLLGLIAGNVCFLIDQLYFQDKTK